MPSPLSLLASEITSPAESWQLGLQLGTYAVVALAAIIQIIRLAIKKFQPPPADQRYGDPQVFEQLVRLDKNINARLVECRLFTDCLRALIYQFHNGTYYYGGSPMTRMTLAYESTAEGFSEIKEEENRLYEEGMVISAVSMVLDKMYEDTPLINKLPPTPTNEWETRMSRLNVRFYAVLPLYQELEGKRWIIGCLMLHWRDTPTKNDQWITTQTKASLKIVEQLLADRLLVSGKKE